MTLGAANVEVAEPSANPTGARTRFPYFLITIDTEGDNLWSRPRSVTTRNAEFLERFQQLCERYGQRPTWLTNYEMILSRTYQQFAADVLKRGTAEIGMHLHAWDSPPFEPLTGNDYSSHPYLVEYPPRVMREKIHTLTATLEDTLGVQVVSHRAGRWAFDERYAEMLIEEGYRVDCSVTPLVNWVHTIGVPTSRGGTDYRRFPQEPYWLDLSDISRPGSSPLLEVPVTILSFRSEFIEQLLRVADKLPPRFANGGVLAHRVANRVAPPAVWLRPNGRNRQRLLNLVERVLHEERPHAEFMLHSSEFMPGGSPTFPDAPSIEQLYGDLEALFERIRGRFRPATLSELLADTPRPAGRDDNEPAEAA